MAVWIDGATGEVHTVKNLGWLLRHAREVEYITIRQRACTDYADCDLIVQLTGNRQYITPFADFTLCKRWIDRPVLRGIPCEIVDPAGYSTGGSHVSIG